jgi:hypothetical protein
VLLLLSSCSSNPRKIYTWNYYGIEVDSETYDDDFINKEKTISYIASAMNPNIYARARYTDITITQLVPEFYFQIKVYNESKNPITSNYFIDSFELFTKDGKRYILKGKKYNYPHINPGDKATFYMRAPQALKSELDILKIVVRLGFYTRIVLKPTYEMKQIQHK